MDVFTQILADVFTLTVDIMALFFITFGIAFGFAALFAGRRLFWIFLGAVGLAGGLYIGQQFLPDSPRWITASLTIGLGVVGVLFALYIPKPAASLAAFLTLGSLAYLIATAATLPDWLTWVLFGVLGVIAALLAWRWFDLGVIISSAIVGAVVAAVGVNALLGLVPEFGAGLFLLLVLMGIWYQVRDLRRTRKQDAKMLPVAIAGGAKAAQEQANQAAQAQAEQAAQARASQAAQSAGQSSSTSAADACTDNTFNR